MSASQLRPSYPSCRHQSYEIAAIPPEYSEDATTSSKGNDTDDHDDQDPRSEVLAQMRTSGERTSEKTMAP